MYITIHAMDHPLRIFTWRWRAVFLYIILDTLMITSTFGLKRD